MKPFKFKQFTVHQDKCAMKIGTDGVLLGAWTSLEKNPQSILDIGAGTGVITLQLAQRCSAELIDSIELDEDAYEQCVENFEISSWADRLFCYHAGLDEFVDEMEEKYDLIVSNPPFYSEEMGSGDMARDMARQNNSLPFEDLVAGVSKLLSADGVFNVIVPFKEEQRFIQLTKTAGMHLKRLTHVRGNPASEIKRSLMEFGWDVATPLVNELIIEEQRHVYTKEYIDLTKEFYLKM